MSPCDKSPNYLSVVSLHFHKYSYSQQQSNFCEIKLVVIDWYEIDKIVMINVSVTVSLYDNSLNYLSVVSPHFHKCSLINIRLTEKECPAEVGLYDIGLYDDFSPGPPSATAYCYIMG